MIVCSFTFNFRIFVRFGVSKDFKMAEGNTDEVSRKPDKPGDLHKPPSPPAAKFYEGEKVLCFHGTFLYEAKILKVEFRGNKKEYAYWVHYLRWNKTWDEWIYEKKVLKLSDQNLKKQKELVEAQAEKRKVAKTKLSTKDVSQKRPLGGDDTSVSKVRTYGPSVVKVPKKDSSVVKVLEPEPDVCAVKVKNPCTSVLNCPETDTSVLEVPTSDDNIFKVPTRPLRVRKISALVQSVLKRKERPKAQPKPQTTVESEKIRQVKDAVEPESNYQAKPEVRILLPEKFNIFLADDWHCIMVLNMLPNLPAKITVEKVFTDYLKEKEYKGQNVLELIDGLRQCFNTMLGPQLLFRFERLQFEEQLNQIAEQQENDRQKLTDIYGVPHLIRLFTKLGGFFAFTNMDEDAIDLFRKSIDDLFQFMLKNFDKYFVIDYGMTTPQFQRIKTLIYV